jgi:NTP pyrophosphatase (non-canonical NTP hydrolase)
MKLFFDFFLPVRRFLSQKPSRLQDGTADLGADSLLCAAMGLTGESGEFADLLKKHIWQHHPLEKSALLAELGDVLFYVSYAAMILGSSLEEVSQKNYDKLHRRFGDEGFSVDRSMGRKG